MTLKQYAKATGIYVLCWPPFELAEAGARQPGLHYTEAYESYSTMCTEWSDEKRVRELEALLRCR